MTDPCTFALALERVEGVGRVAAGRLLASFGSYDDLVRYPREQILARLKGVPGAAAVVARLLDAEAMTELLRTAEASRAALAERGVRPLCARDAAWPAGLNRLPPARRPTIFYAYGPLDVLRRPLVALCARPPLDEAAYDGAQALVRHLTARGIAVATGVASGFDVAVGRIVAAGRQPMLLVAACGMARLQPAFRPAVSAAVRGGGLFVSPFAMEHGPFEHDDQDRLLVQTAVAQAVVFVDPRPETPEAAAMAWALEAGMPVFGLAPGALPERVHALRTDVDFDWVAAAARPSGAPSSDA